MAATAPATSPITPEDAASGFTCGEPALDRFFAQHAVENHEKGIGTTFVLRATCEGDPPVLGYYTLSMSAVPAKALRKALGRNLPRYPMPVALLGRLAVHERGQGRGLGQRLLGDALRRVHSAGGIIGCVGVIVEAKNEAAERFYLRYGFAAIDSNSWPHRLFLPMSTLRAGLDS